MLGGLTLGEIPIAGSKRRSIAISLQGQLYRIGRIPANKAFVIIRGNLRLLYVAPDYNNYRYAARKIFGTRGEKLDIDHVLGRKLTQHHRFWYTLVTRIDLSANRSHGGSERAPEAAEYEIVLDKFCYTDERILRKILSLRRPDPSGDVRASGYEIVKAHERSLSLEDTLKARQALGMDGLDVDLDCLRPIAR